MINAKYEQMPPTFNLENNGYTLRIKSQVWYWTLVKLIQA